MHKSQINISSIIVGCISNVYIYMNSRYVCDEDIREKERGYTITACFLLCIYICRYAVNISCCVYTPFFSIHLFIIIMIVAKTYILYKNRYTLIHHTFILMHVDRTRQKKYRRYIYTDVRRSIY